MQPYPLVCTYYVYIFCVDLISNRCGIYGLVFDLSWHCGLKEVFWNGMRFYRDNVILPQYDNGILGLPSTMPFK